MMSRDGHCREQAEFSGGQYRQGPDGPVVAATLARVAQASLELIGVFAQVVQETCGMSLLIRAKGGSEPRRPLSHMPQVIAEQLCYTSALVVWAVREELCAVGVMN
jgi:hypothetical protein